LGILFPTHKAVILSNRRSFDSAEVRFAQDDNFVVAEERLL
jgi:hypothetical protein